MYNNWKTPFKILLHLHHTQWRHVEHVSVISCCHIMVMLFMSVGMSVWQYGGAVASVYSGCIDIGPHIKCPVPLRMPLPNPYHRSKRVWPLGQSICITHYGIIHVFRFGVPSFLQEVPGDRALLGIILGIVIILYKIDNRSTPVFQLFCNILG
jgi:hypothetical protein